MKKEPSIRFCATCGIEFEAKHAMFCSRCRFKNKKNRLKKYVWTPEKDEALRKHYDGKVKGRAAQIARALGWPTWVIKSRAQKLGLCYPVDRKDWMDAEVKFLLDHAGDRSDKWIARKLNRSLTSVVLKCKRLKISRRVRRGYTMRELELCFGVDHHQIQRWIRQGKLIDQRRGTDRKPQQGGDAHSITDEAVVDFICNHPMEFRLDKVDQFWFMDLILAGALVRKALAAVLEREDDEEAA